MRDLQQDLLMGITHLSQTTVKIVRDRIIYIDPYEIVGKPQDADIVLITHDHMDHLSIADIRKVMKEGTHLVIPKRLKGKCKELKLKITPVKPLKKYEVEGVGFETVPAYNIDKPFHPKKMQWVGYILFLDGKRYYYSGDTDFIPEMEGVEADAVFLPVGGTYMMTASEAAKAANTIRPEVAIPFHFGKLVGTQKDAELFIEKLDKDIHGSILKNH